jgi:predicted nucleic acid-binding protein
MSLSNFLINPHAIIVADASVVINLNATGRAREIIAARPNRWAVTENAFAELVSGTRNGHDDAHRLQGLIDDGLVDIACLGADGSDIYEALVGGSALRTLDDGEAATIGYAREVSGIAMIDERKARTLCADMFPELPVISTVELLLHESITLALGERGRVEAIIGALQLARMRVPPNQISSVVAVIGAENAASCMSLPKAARAAS